MPKAKVNVLFLCTGNACRSQMCEGWARHLKETRIEAWSAGVALHGLDPRVVQVMAEEGVDISGQTAKRVDTLLHLLFDYVVTVCDSAAERCPFTGPAPASWCSPTGPNPHDPREAAPGNGQGVHIGGFSESR